MMPTAANAQKVASAGRREVTPRTKAIMSVSEVIVIETPAAPIAFPIRTGTDCFSTPSASSAATRTNMSSTPMPIRMNGSTLITGLSERPKATVRPYATAIDIPTDAQPAIARRTRDLTGWHRVKMKTAYTRMIRNDA